MSQENVETFKRAVEAYGRRDDEALLEVLDAEVELYPALLVAFGAEANVYRGHDGAREWFRDTDDAFTARHVEIVEIRDLGERLVARGRIRLLGKESRAEVESPIGYLVDFRNGKVVRLRSYLRPEDALDAAGLRE
jgi:ketosteroid isomerase-like protein